MEEYYTIFATAAVILLYFLMRVARRTFDPFEPVWLFLVGYIQVYVVQALSYHEWAVGARGQELVEAANFRALWALLWFLVVYHLGFGRLVAKLLARPPRNWSAAWVVGLTPVMIIWGLFCAGVMIQGAGGGADTLSPEESLLRSFPFLMLGAAVLLIVTGRTINSPHRLFLPAGLAVAAAYVLIWMYNGRRAHSLIGVLATVCAFYITRLKRPAWPVLVTTALAGSLVVSIALGWRNDRDYERSFTGFFHYLGDFKLAKILESIGVKNDEDAPEVKTYETVEYGGYLLILDTVPARSDFDYGENYLRVFSTFIPRILWPSKPLFGRSQWVNAWIAGSELERDEEFTGPAISILGAAQLNGGAIATLVVLALAALLLRTGYEYLCLYPEVPWVQFWWSIIYYNAWFMVVCDDPLVWFYYNWGMSTFPIVVLLWWLNRGGGPAPHQAHATGLNFGPVA
jgi:hypothetical protein